MWWHNWRYLPHMKDEALSPKGELMELLPIAPATDAIRAEVEPAVQRLIALANADRQRSATVLDWLRIEFGVEKPGQRLEALAALDRDGFVHEVTRRRPVPPGGCRRLGCRRCSRSTTSMCRRCGSTKRRPLRWNGVCPIWSMQPMA